MIMMLKSWTFLSIKNDFWIFNDFLILYDSICKNKVIYNCYWLCDKKIFYMCEIMKNNEV